MKRYYGYIRVSTVRQGEKGTSLAEQKAAIESYCRREGIVVSEWFEEQHTAAKVGRSIFIRMLKSIKQGTVAGLVLHKIDRGARNLKDWAELSQLVDAGVDVRIAGDSVDLRSRGGRLSGDILAVVAADYIRNLRDEVKKGQRGRLKQGHYPWSAPIGYLNTGAGGVKTVDPVQSTLVREAFRLYATGNYAVKTLRHEMVRRGLTTRSGRAITVNSMHLLLKRSFYYGRIAVNNESFVGSHDPLISKATYDTVQKTLAARLKRKTYGTRTYLFQHRLQCSRCERLLYAETQKGNVYYRCHSDGCKGTSLRETSIIERMTSEVESMSLTDEALEMFANMFSIHTSSSAIDQDDTKRFVNLQLSQISARQSRLIDAFLDQALDRTEYESRKTSLINEHIVLTERLVSIENPSPQSADRQSKFLELLSGLQCMGEMEEFAKKRAALICGVSNFVVTRKTVDIQWKSTVQMLLNKGIILSGGDERDNYRTPNAPSKVVYNEEKMREIIKCVLTDESM